MICIRCGSNHDAATVGFKASCEKCGCYLHSCVQCTLWDRSSERCRSLTTEPVACRDGLNFCEEYVPNSVYLDPSSGSGCRDQARGRFLDLFEGKGNE